MKMIKHPTVAQFIAQRIKESSKSQLEIAEACGWGKTPNMVTMVKQGKSRLPLEKIGPMATALGVQPVYLPDQRFAPPAYPYVREEFGSTIREANPIVTRGESVIRRRSDGKILVRSIRYWRTGGDFPTGLAHESHYGCPPRWISAGKCSMSNEPDDGS
jgi:transcriptional regulator with XRE-family HTH domain